MDTDAARPRPEARAEIREGDGWAVASLDALGAGPGFRKVRAALGVTAFGVNGVVLPPHYLPHAHAHDLQQELYFVHRGRVEMRFGDGRAEILEPGSLARVDPATPRSFRALGDEEAVVLVVGGRDGYVGRDAHVVADLWS
jgi:quercetin dioxygenase-like cupin family protein